ncbi:MAG: toxin [Candidatus Acidulodesulfobacterium ferriphilum]|jgi:hypothetical protein|uniref:Toxin n=1 Tax=Candidatus Acidulodesulfobacterium ferriphilum TaxID=2597223 RepID=A0A519BC03_9DELT|nr:MAG: toxin [Candidatus Acidulodesulfobacterium ferriphilum]
MEFKWDEAKNNLLKYTRDVCFEDIILAINQGGLLDIIRHKNQRKYPDQLIFVVEINEYAYLVPFEIEDNLTENNKCAIVFLKTVIPSRKATNKYLRGNKNEKEK